MLAASLLMMASTFLWPSASVNWPPRTTVEELNAMVKTGHYHLIREQWGLWNSSVRVGRW